MFEFDQFGDGHAARSRRRSRRRRRSRSPAAATRSRRSRSTASRTASPTSRPAAALSSSFSKARSCRRSRSSKRGADGNRGCGCADGVRSSSVPARSAHSNPRLSSRMPPEPHAARTKIVATLGPASSEPEVARAHDRAPALDVVRMNFSHGTADEHTNSASSSCASSRRKPAARSACSSTCRARRSASASSRTAAITLASGDSFVLDADRDARRPDGVGLDYKELPQDVRAGDTLLLDDGRIVLDVDGVRGSRIHRPCRAGRRAVEQQGHQPPRRRPHRARAHRQGHATTSDAAAELKADFLGVSFPRSGADMYMGARSHARRPAAKRCWSRRSSAPRRSARARRHPRRVRRDHGRARRSRGRGRRRRRARAAEAHDPARAREATR